MYDDDDDDSREAGGGIFPCLKFCTYLMYYSISSSRSLALVHGISSFFIFYLGTENPLTEKKNPSFFLEVRSCVSVEVQGAAKEHSASRAWTVVGLPAGCFCRMECFFFLLGLFFLLPELFSHTCTASHQGSRCRCCKQLPLLTRIGQDDHHTTS
jgi:hypothetical protein